VCNKKNGTTTNLASSENGMGKNQIEKKFFFGKKMERIFLFSTNEEAFFG